MPLADDPTLLCLHAAAVAVADRLVVLAGEAYAGKSKLPAALLARGEQVFCDDMEPLIDGFGIALGIPLR